MKRKGAITLGLLVIGGCILIAYTKLRENEIKDSTMFMSNNKTNQSVWTDIKGTEKIVSEQKMVDFDIVKMGHYEQDNNADNGPELIEWLVLYEDEEKQYLLSRYILDNVIVNYESSASWEDTKGYNWLNNTFFNSAFSEDERDKILLTHIDEEVNENVEKSYLQPAYDAYLFYLNGEEIDKYFLTKEGGSEYKKGFVAYKTPFLYANSPLKYQDEKKQKEINDLASKGVLFSAEWPTRTPGSVTHKYSDDKPISNINNFIMVTNNDPGNPYSDKYVYDSRYNMVGYGLWNQRPAMWVKK